MIYKAKCNAAEIHIVTKRIVNAFPMIIIEFPMFYKSLDYNSVSSSLYLPMRNILLNCYNL